jgi:hypothetical protein
LLKPTLELDDQVECPVCGSKIVRNNFRIAETNMKFLLENSADGTLNEALTILRILIEKVPGITIDVSHKSALEEYFKKIQEQIARTVVTPIALLVESADRLMERLSELGDKVPLSVKGEFVEISKELAKKLKNMEKNSTEAPLIMFNATLNPLMERLERLTEKLPEEIREEFKETRTDLQEKLLEIESAAEKSSIAVGSEVKELRNSINSLINKPAVLGRVSEGVLAELWKAEFAQDLMDPLGGPGQPDALVVPYLGMNGGDYGRKISLERKAGAQKYCGKHVEEVGRHARKYGATQAMLIYDSKANLPEEFRPMKVLFRSQQKLTIAVACLDERTWVTAREILEVLQITDPPDDESKNPINAIELDKAISDMQTINATIDKLRKTNNSAIRNCEGTRTHIEELEESILGYQNRLKQIIDKRNKGT